MQFLMTEIVNFISTFLSLITLVVVFLTLQEMKTQRNKQYKPSIVFERASYSISTRNFKKESEFKIANDAASIGEYDAMKIVLRNIGAFPARDVKIHIAKRNLDFLRHSFKSVDLSHLKEEPIGIYKITDPPNCTHFIEAEISYAFPYLLGNAENELNFYIPTIYTVYIKEILLREYSHTTAEKLVLEIDVKYSDICGKRYSETIQLFVHVQSILMQLKNDGQINFDVSMVKSDR